MQDGTGSADGETWESKLREWRQADYSLTLAEILTVDGLIEEDGILPDVAAAAVPGLVVVTQTCDIVNSAPGKDYVVVCPLRELTEQALEDVRKGRSPAGAMLEHPPRPNVVVDLGRMMSVHKSVLARMERLVGFPTDEGRARFAADREALNMT